MASELVAALFVALNLGLCMHLCVCVVCRATGEVTFYSHKQVGGDVMSSAPDARCGVVAEKQSEKTTYSPE